MDRPCVFLILYYSLNPSSSCSERICDSEWKPLEEKVGMQVGESIGYPDLNLDFPNRICFS